MVHMLLKMGARAGRHLIAGHDPNPEGPNPNVDP